MTTRERDVEPAPRVAAAPSPRASSEPAPPTDALERARATALVSFALLLGLFEGPAEVACAVALVSCLASPGARARLPWVLADVGLVVWLLAGLPGMLGGDVRVGGEPSLRPLLALAYVLGRLVVHERPVVLARMGMAFVAGLLVNVGYGYVQVLVADPGLERLIVGRARSAHLMADSERLRMATGLYYNRIKLAHVGVVGLGLLVLVTLDHLRRGGAVGRRVALVLATAFLAGGLLLTYRRAAPAALLVGLVTVGLTLRQRRRAAALVMVGGLLVGALALSDYGRERLDAASDDVGTRAQIWASAGRLVLEHPVLGSGHGGYGPGIRAHTPPDASAELLRNVLNSPHNAALYVLAETGVVGFAGWCLAVLSSLVALLRAVRREAAVHTARTQLDRLAVVGLVTIAALGVVHTVLYHASVALLFWGLLGVAAARLPPLGHRTVVGARPRPTHGLTA